MSVLGFSAVTMFGLLAVTVSVTAYPAKDDDSFYYGRLHDLANFNKETRNLDGIDGRLGVAALPLMAKADQDLGANKGSQTKYRFESHSGSHLDGIGGGHLVRDLDLEQGGGNLLRDLDLLRNRADLLSRASRDGENDKKQGMAYHYMDPLSGNTIGLAKRFHPFDSLRFGNDPNYNKREMDEIDRTAFNRFVKKNFDEIDRSGFGSFVKKNFDEIDRSGFGSFVKRSAPQSAPEAPQN